MLPNEVYRLCVQGGLIVGSVALRMAGLIPPGTPKDYDILVPFVKWSRIAPLIPRNAELNSFGGWKFRTTKGIEVDVWPGDLQGYLAACKSRYGGQVVAIDFINNRVFSSRTHELFPIESPPTEVRT